MDAFGHIQDGVVVLEGDVRLPEGSRVYVAVAPLAMTPRIYQSPVQRPVKLPVFGYDGPPDLELTNERIAEILDSDDASG